jgi:uncharacterized OB-fold protein
MTTRADLGVTLPAEGTLWTWTVQRFAPKSPPYVPPEDGFRPFAVGYVELDGGPRVVAVLDVPDPADVHIGMRMRVQETADVPHASPVEEGS